MDNLLWLVQEFKFFEAKMTSTQKIFTTLDYSYTNEILSALR